MPSREDADIVAERIMVISRQLHALETSLSEGPPSAELELVRVIRSNLESAQQASSRLCEQIRQVEQQRQQGRDVVFEGYGSVPWR